MEILAYGEDALTFWALTSKLPVILQTLKDSSTPSNCRVFYRPGFGRRGGDNSSQFGEFDFILLSKHRLYLGESKWDSSSERIQGGVLDLPGEQRRRHEVFNFYIEEWAFGSYASWSEFEERAKLKLRAKGITKPRAPANSLLASNLQTVLGVIRKHYTALPDVRNVLLYLYDGASVKQLPNKAGQDFEVVPIDYSGNTFDNFIRIEV